MHRGCTSILRNGILKQYPPVLLRLGRSNAFGIDANSNKRLWQNNCDSHKHPISSSSLTVQNEEELRRACVHMIQQCQLMVRKLQLQENRLSSKSARRRRNPRNLNSNEKTVQNICYSDQPLCSPALVAAQHQPPPPALVAAQHQPPPPVLTRTTTGESTDIICHCCCTSATNKHDKVKEDNDKCGDNSVIAVAAPSLGPKLLQLCTVAPSPTTKPAVEHQFTNRRGTTRKRVLSTCSRSTHAPPLKCHANVKPSSDDSNRNLCDVKSGAPVQPLLQLSVTPLQNRLRAEARARADRCTIKPLVHSKAERAVDIIYQSTMTMMEQLGRLPRILQTPMPIQFLAPPVVNRSAKNSLPNLPFLQSAKKYPKKTYARAKTETFLHSPCETPPYAHPPPKILNDCSSSKRLYSRTNVGQPRPVKKIVAPAPASAKSKISCCRVVGSNQQVRQIMTSASSKQSAASSGGNEKGPPKSNDSNAEATCTGRVQTNKLKPQCTLKMERHVCRAETAIKPCTIEKVAGPCRDQLKLATTATPQAHLKSLGMGPEKLHKGSKIPSCAGTLHKQVKVEPHKPPGHCPRPPPSQGTSSVTRQGNDNVCSALPHSTPRLRRPPIPKHLLKRQAVCFEPCMSKQLESRRTLGNCDKMLLNRDSTTQERVPDPMQRPVDPCAAVNRCKQAECPVLREFAPPPKTNADLPPPVLPFPKDMCGQPDPDAVPPYSPPTNEERCPSEKEIKCKLRRPINTSDKTKNTCGPVQPKAKRPPPVCAYKDDESFVCQSDAEALHPAYPDPICPPVATSDTRPQRVKYIDVFRHVPCAKRSMTREERLEVDDYCDPCYKAKELHQYSGTAYYDMHNYMAGRRRIIPGPNNYRRKWSWKEEPC